MASTGIVIKQGYLHRKRERTGTNVLKKPWQSGYYVLMESPIIQGLMLEEYKDASLKILKQSVVLGAIKHVGQVNTSKSKQFAFEIVTMAKTALMLASDNESLMNEWMRTFANYMPSHRGSPEGSPCPMMYPDNGSLDVSKMEHMDRRDTSQFGTPKSRAFEVKVQKTPLSVDNNLFGSYMMQITKSRVFLKTINGKEDVLSWPLNQLRGFKSHPDAQQVVFETGRRCHFGEGRLAFQTPRSEEIVEIIRQTPVPGSVTVDGRRDSYRMNNLHRHSSSSSFDSDHEKRKESGTNEDRNLCTVHVSGSRGNGDKVVKQTPLASSISAKHPLLRKQDPVCLDGNLEESNDVFDNPIIDARLNLTDRRARDLPIVERGRSTDSSEISFRRGVSLSTSTRGSESESLDESSKLKCQGDESRPSLTSITDRYKVDEKSEAIDSDGEGHSYLELIADESERERKVPDFQTDDDEELLSRVVEDLTNPLKPKERFMTTKSASTGGMESSKPDDQDKVRRASAPNVGQKLTRNASIEDGFSLSNGSVNSEEKFSKHSILTAKRTVKKLEDIKEVASFDNDSVHVDRETPDAGRQARPRSLSDTAPKKHGHKHLKDSGRSKTCDAAVGTPSNPVNSLTASERNNSSAPVSPFKKAASCEVRVNDKPIRDPVTQLLMFPASKTPSFPKSLFLPMDIQARDRSRSPFTLSREPSLTITEHPSGTDIRPVRSNSDDLDDAPPVLPPKSKSPPMQNKANEPPYIPKRAPVRERSISRELSDTQLIQKDVRPYINSPPPLTPRRPDAVPLKTIPHSRSSESLLPPPRPPKPGGLAPLEPTKSLPPFASGVENSKRGSDSGRCFSPLAIDTSFHFSVHAKTKTFPESEHHLRSPGQRVKWRVPNVTPPRSPHVDDRKV